VRFALAWLAALLLLPGIAAAQSKEQDIETLLEAVGLEERVAASNRAIRAVFIRGLRQRASASANPRMHELIEEEYDNTFTAARLMAEVKPRVSTLFAERLSQGEVRELTDLVRSPAFAKYRALNGQIGRVILTAIQTSVKSGMGDLMKRVTDRAIAEGVKK
jgi:hypothetical protein